MNLTELLDRTASRWPDKPALIEGSTIVSYAALVEKVAALASQLQAIGIPAGCRVGLCCPNGSSYVALTFALWRINAVVVAIPMECPEQEVSSIAAMRQGGAILS